MKTNIKDLKELIVSQQLTIHSLQKRVNDLQESYERRQEWISKAKREAGADYIKSFDDVWKEMLDKPSWDDVRNKMTPFKNLIALIENGQLKATLQLHYILNKEIIECKKIIEQLNQSNV